MAYASLSSVACGPKPLATEIGLSFAGWSSHSFAQTLVSSSCVSQFLTRGSWLLPESGFPAGELVTV